MSDSQTTSDEETVRLALASNRVATDAEFNAFKRLVDELDELRIEVNLAAQN